MGHTFLEKQQNFNSLNNFQIYNSQVKLGENNL